MYYKYSSHDSLLSDLSDALITVFINNSKLCLSYLSNDEQYILSIESLNMIII